MQTVKFSDDLTVKYSPSDVFTPLEAGLSPNTNAVRVESKATAMASIVPQNSPSVNPSSAVRGPEGLFPGVF